MSNHEMWSRIRAAHLGRILLVYAGASWAVLEATGFFIDNFSLPEWFLPGALLLLVIGFVVVTATALIQAVPRRAAQSEDTASSSDQASAVGARSAAAPGVRRFFTWRNALTGGVLAFALWGVAAAGWLLLSDGPVATAEMPGERADGVKKLVVLPFENLSAEQDDYFAAGITDAITARLARLSGLGIISRQSAVQYADSDKSAQEIGSELDVQYILEGTVQRERPDDPESRVRVIPQLIRISDDTHVWAATYDEDMAEVFRVQSDIAERVAQALDIALLEPERQAIEERPSDNLQAYDFYLRGNDYRYRGDLGYLERAPLTAVEFYERAVELDPEFAEAWAALGRAHIQVWLYGFDPDSSRLERARAAARRALALQPDLAEGHVAMGEYHGQSYQLERAMEEFQRARALNSGDAELLRYIAMMHRRTGQRERALATLERAVELDPRSVTTTAFYSLVLDDVGRHEEAETQLDRAIALAPDQINPYTWKIDHYLEALGDLDGARRVIRDGSARMGRMTFVANLLSSSFYPFRILDDELGDDLRQLSIGSFGHDTVSHYFYYLARGWQERVAGGQDVAHAYYDSARVILEDWARRGPTNVDVLQRLALAYAGLGRAPEAIETMKRALEIVSPSVDVIDGNVNAYTLATVHAMTGRREEALDVLEDLAAREPRFVPSLRIDPIWDPLREDPRFQTILATATASP